MDAAIKEQWIKDLRSGEFEQGRGKLEEDHQFCCLGVLCFRAAEAGITSRVVEANGVVTYGGMDGVPPSEVLKWAGLNIYEAQGRYAPADGEERWLTMDNDRDRHGFDQIADTIEKHF
jgi:hypothetical protein